VIFYLNNQFNSYLNILSTKHDLLKKKKIPSKARSPDILYIYNNSALFPIYVHSSSVVGEFSPGRYYERPDLFVPETGRLAEFKTDDKMETSVFSECGKRRTRNGRTVQMTIGRAVGTE